MVIVQVGTNRGNDEMASVVKSLNPDKLILVEPMAIHNEFIEQVYGWHPNKIIKNVAVVGKKMEKGEVTFYYHPKDTPPHYQLAGLTMDHIVKHGFSCEEIESLTVPCVTISDIFDEHGLTEIDLLCIDAEGHDLSIILSIDFGKYKIKNLIFEYIHMNPAPLYNGLNGIGYNCYEAFWLYSSLATLEKGIPEALKPFCTRQDLIGAS